MNIYEHNEYLINAILIGKSKKCKWFGDDAFNEQIQKNKKFQDSCFDASKTNLIMLIKQIFF